MYFQKKRCIAMLLAGGQGSRLKVLTEKTAKPAMFVTWACKNGNDYCWGHYLGSRADAERDLVKRAAERLRFLESIRGCKRKEFGR